MPSHDPDCERSRATDMSNELRAMTSVTFLQTGAL